MQSTSKIAILFIVILSSGALTEGQSVYFSLPDIYEEGDFVQFYIDYYGINDTNGERIDFNESYGQITHEFLLTHLKYEGSNSAYFDNQFHSFESEIVYYNRYEDGYKPNWLFTDLAGYKMGDEILEFQEDLTDAFDLDETLDTKGQYFIVDETEYLLELDGANTSIPAWVVEMRFDGYSNWGDFNMHISVDIILSKTTGIWLKVSGSHLYTYDSGQINTGGGVEAFAIAASGVNFDPTVRTRSEQAGLPLVSFVLPLILISVILRHRFRN
ncbi:MAG: hypothetical protein GPJ54_06135 [Candidatus Heimdallarchaeota archaeon]|nr:hypothetical protein [Candidatus Heimdallarchaeota archaeon]